ncbi:MAG: hypothetical protein H6573_03480 [Lewinellaceae bacterium]|nr:hypothetical protein [Phaeodactylibacter sp.]MCB0614366.1 hypothetical protein [Phaeodactylibacter sp.]MCB9346557.1 hypothetical protein [Lewinellaceae bacterium]
MKLTALILTLYFLLGSLLPGTDFSQLKKAPALWEHYNLHRSLVAAVGEKPSFFDFLYTHFWDTESHNHHDGGHSHQGLPLKTIHVFSHILPSGSIALKLASLPAACHQLIPHHHSFFSAIHDGAIFRPPILS